MKNSEIPISKFSFLMIEAYFRTLSLIYSCFIFNLEAQISTSRFICICKYIYTYIRLHLYIRHSEHMCKGTWNTLHQPRKSRQYGANRSFHCCWIYIYIYINISLYNDTLFSLLNSALFLPSTIVLYFSIDVVLTVSLGRKVVLFVFPHTSMHNCDIRE